MVREKIKPTEKDDLLSDRRKLVLFNDEVNTFDFVIETLIEVCDHDPNQAEQCAMIAHFNGKCNVLSGTFVELKPAWHEMTRRQLTVEIK